MSWMQTHSGRAFSLLDPKPEDVSFVDIAHSLARICRFNGHTRVHYSVAEHCCLISDWLGKQGIHQRIMLAGLLHDAPEAYVGDIIWPVYQALPEVRAAVRPVQERIWQAIRVALDLPETVDVHHERVKDADLRILLDERTALLQSPPPIPWEIEHLGPLRVEIKRWPADRAEEEWLARLDRLTSLVRGAP